MMKARAEVITGEAMETMSRMADGSIDLTVTSPPYDNLRTYQGFTFDFEGIARELFRVTKQGGVVVWVVGDATVNGSETGTSFKQALYFKEIGFNLHDTMIYRKNALSFPETNRYYPNFEYMFVFSKGQPSTVNLIADKANNTAGERVSGSQRGTDGTMSLMCGARKGNVTKPFGVRWNVWEYQTGGGNTTRDTYAFAHPAMFPEQLAYDHIISWSNEGDTVLDPMCGSGTTGKMAVIAKRNFIGIEISPEYAEIARARISRAQGIPCDIPKSNRPHKPTPLFDEQVA